MSNLEELESVNCEAHLHSCFNVIMASFWNLGGLRFVKIHKPLDVIDTLKMLYLKVLLRL